MIQFNELALSEDKKKIKIDCEATGQSEYIKSVKLVYHRNTNSADIMQSEGQAVLYSEPDGSTTHVTEFDDEITMHDLVDTDGRFYTEKFGAKRFDKGLFFLIVEYVDGDNEGYVLGAVWDRKAFKDKGMNIVKIMSVSELGPCTDTRAWVDFILQWEAFKLSAASDDYSMMSMLWAKMMNADSTGTGCGCK